MLTGIHVEQLPVGFLPAVDDIFVGLPVNIPPVFGRSQIDLNRGAISTQLGGALNSPGACPVTATQLQLLTGAALSLIFLGDMTSVAIDAIPV